MRAHPSFVLLFSMALFACSAQPVETNVPTDSEREPVVCGELTCGPAERCVIQCECCGIPVPPEELKASFRCEPMPAECSDNADPTIDCRRLVEYPCP